MTPAGLVGVQQRIAEIQSRFPQPAAFAAGLARAQQAAGGSAGFQAGAAPAVPAPGAQVAPAAPSPWAVGGSAGAGTGGARPAPDPAGAAAGAPAAPTQPAAGPATAVPAGPGAPGSGWAAALPDRARQWLPAIESAARGAGIDPRLLASLVQAESGFRADARSHAGAIGLGQLMPGTARALGVDPHDPVQNLQGAARYLREQLDRFGSVELALAAYNAGPGRVAKAGGIPRITETQNYVAGVVRTYDRLRST